MSKPKPDIKSRIVADLQRVAELEAPAEITRVIYRRRGKISMSQIEKAFGSFTAARKAAGLGESKFGRSEVTQDDVKRCIDEGLTAAEAAARLGIHERTYRLRKAALARQGYSPEHDMHHLVPDGFHAKGVSTLYDEAGKPRMQWVKSSIDRERQAELMREAVAAMAEDIPRATPVPAPANSTNAALANCYVITDYHIGMYSWPEETGDDWSTELAEEMLVAWFAAAIEQAPNAKVGVLAQLGDLLHHDGERVTPTSRHILDMDTRFQKMVRVVIRAVRRIIQMLLEKHDQVHAIMADANHDPASGAWLRELFFAMYEDEPRITVDRSPDSYYCYEFGQTSLYFHHGHRRGVSALDQVCAAKFREVFGRTQWSYAHTGHQHHKQVKESSLMEVEQHQTLAAADAYASSHGYLSKRSAQVITYHRDWGEVGRIRITPEMLRAPA